MLHKRLIRVLDRFLLLLQQIKRRLLDFSLSLNPLEVLILCIKHKFLHIPVLLQGRESVSHKPLDLKSVQLLQICVISDPKSIRRVFCALIVK